MGYLLNIAKKIQTPVRGAANISLVVDNKPSTEKNAYTTKPNIVPPAIVEPGAIVKALWPPEVQSIVDWFMTLDLPTEPFFLEAHRHVVDPEKFFQSLRQDIEAGLDGPRARMGTLQYDLQKLKVLYVKGVYGPDDEAHALDVDR
jgi:hypothetical protein